MLRNLASSVAVFGLLFVAASHGAKHKNHLKRSYLLYVGTYTGPASKGIYGYRFNSATGEITSLGLMAETANPAFLAVDPDRRFLYAVNEVSNFQGQKSGSVTAFAIDRKSGKLTLLNQVPSRGEGPCFVALDDAGKHVLVANYGSGSAAIFPVLEDGRLGEASAVVQHGGHGPDPVRQEGPHPHDVGITHNKQFAIVTDLGLDQLFVYRFDPEKGTLTANNPPSLKVAPGLGPRHFALAPNSKFLYVINELISSVTAFSFDDTKGTEREIATVSTLPNGYKGTSFASEIALSPDGKFVYASNRGHDSIAILAIDPATGALKLSETVSSGGKTPRHFEITPNGQHLIAGNQGSNNLVIFSIDKKTGHLTPSGQLSNVPSPVCVKVLEID